MKASINTISLMNGQFITPSANVTVIVGPNNVGKSAILSDVLQHVTNDQYSQPQTLGRPVSAVAVDMPSFQELMAMIEARTTVKPPGFYANVGQRMEPFYTFENGFSIAHSAIQNIAGRTDRFGALAQTFLIFLGPEGRGAVLASTSVPDLVGEQPRNPVQMLWGDRALEAEMSGYMQRAFNVPLTVNRHAGLNVHLHMGSVDVAEPQLGEQSGYLDAAMELPMVSQQGAGIQAFMGTVATLLAGNYDIVLLDEPETFLHPPQARLLGEIVTEMSRKSGMQVIAATHSDDFLQGIINASEDSSEVSVVRLTRPSATENRVSQVAPDAVESLYKDPLLRFSNILDGIFYKGVVVCEAESDCTYYSAVASHIEKRERRGASDLLFTQCGGKDRLGRAYSALSAASIPTAVIADVDILADKAKFRTLFETMGGKFAAIEASYNILESSIRQKDQKPRRMAVKAEFNSVLDGSVDDSVSPQELKALRAALKNETGWTQVKKKGRGFIDSGGPTEAFASIRVAAASAGLFILEVGELERFHPEVGGNKQEWLRKVLEGQLYERSDNAAALMNDVLSFVSTQQ